MDVSKVNRVEVITSKKGRELVIWEEKPLKIEFDLQDGDRTLKIFID